VPVVPPGDVLVIKGYEDGSVSYVWAKLPYVEWVLDSMSDLDQMLDSAHHALTERTTK